ncbi:DUF739 family protein [Facklamia sp. P12945]|uniref:DUF739 family protein n=1 Tax=unclassified Facklamia TaxID=2622293 RepID=UPI003D168FF8
MLFDYSKLKGRIKEKFNTYKNLTPLIDMSESTLSRKLNGKGYFDSQEIIDLSEALSIPDEERDQYFFNVKVRKTKQPS